MKKTQLGSANLSDAEYKKLWEKLRIEIKMIEMNGECKPPYNRPGNVCFALLHVLDLYTWRAVLGYPSWNAENREVYRVHCPDAGGTVWEMRAVRRPHS